VKIFPSSRLSDQERCKKAFCASFFYESTKSDFLIIAQNDFFFFSKRKERKGENAGETVRLLPTNCCTGGTDAPPFPKYLPTKAFLALIREIFLRDVLRRKKKSTIGGRNPF
jgi:hypothetical protein